MNWDVVEGKWKQLKGAAKAKWGDLTDDELDQLEGNREKMAGKLQEKYGWTKDEAEKQVDEFARDLDNDVKNS